MKFMSGPKPMNLIFKSFLRMHEPVDVENEDLWKLWYYSVASYQKGQSSQEPSEPKRPIGEEEPIFEDGVDYGNSDEEDEDLAGEQDTDYSCTTWSETSRSTEVVLRSNEPRVTLTENERQLIEEVDNDLRELGDNLREWGEQHWKKPRMILDTSPMHPRTDSDIRCGSLEILLQ